jgi:hypothetical protein
LGGAVYTKGAAEIVLGRCSHVHAARGAAEGGPLLAPLDQSARRRLEATIQRYAARALRTLALAHKLLTAQETTALLQRHRPPALTAGAAGATRGSSSSGGGGGGRSAGLGGGEAALSLGASDWDSLDLGLTLDLLVGIQVRLQGWDGEPNRVLK